MVEKRTDAWTCLYVCVLCVTCEKILEEPVTSWPVVDALISFFSKGYVYAHACAYVYMVQGVVKVTLVLWRRDN